jgi:hypothetical protein
MHKAQKTQAKMQLDQISKKHDEIKRAIEQNRISQAQELLAQCQQEAIDLGNFIESSEGEDCNTVHLLENYCELIYSTHEELSNSKAVNENKICKNLRKHLIQIENSINNDIPIKKEIAFFPYKASMWDSLESIYLAAKEDKNCDAYCVPIPYYDLKPDHSFGEMHYEGDQYPKNIEITDWQTYNFEERHPDTIYIHNPYDNWNLVTSVHPRFYSKNLKTYTEELVYVPYFVLKEIEPGDQRAIDGMKHFIWTPGVINADKVIVQSEKMKQIYVNEYLKAAKESGLKGSHQDRNYLDKKILGLGSPKFDKAKNTKKEDLEIPEEWLNIIKKPDGTWKKIIFYNTSIGALLQNREKMLEKMKYVFSIFKENQDEVALLWRPHPLIENTVKSMLPILWEQYKEIVDQYKQEGWGIYDDSSDMNRAVILSDGYYGDGSSAVQIYQQTGKPVMIQNIECNKKEYDICYQLNSWCQVDKYIYFVPSNLNVLIKYNTKNGITEQIHSIPNVNQEKFALYSDVKNYKNKLFFTPMHGTKIIVYDMDKDEFEPIAIPYSSHWNCEWGNFSKSYICGHNLYMIGYRYPAIIKLNMDTYKCEQVLDLYPLFGQNKKNICIALDSILNGEDIYVVLQDMDKMVKYNIKTQESITYNIPNDSSEHYKTVVFDGKYFWLTQNGYELAKWNEEEQKLEIFTHPKYEKIINETMYRYSFWKNGKIYLFSTKEAPIVVFNCNDMEKSRLIWKDEENSIGFKVDYVYTNGQECSFIDLDEYSNKILNLENDEIIDANWFKDSEKIVQTMSKQIKSIMINEGGVSLSNMFCMLMENK